MDRNFKLLLDAIERLEKQIGELRLASKTYLTFSETCDFFGFKPQTLYKYTSRGRIPFSKKEGKLIRFNKEEVENWFKEVSIRRTTSRLA